MKNKLLILFLLFGIGLMGCAVSERVPVDRGEVGIYNSKFIWTDTGEAFVPNYVMLNVLIQNLSPEEIEKDPELASFIRSDNMDLRFVTEENLDKFIDEFMHGHGFNGIHIPVCGQWFHIGEYHVSEDDSLPDPRTFEKMAMIINKVYEAGGSTYFWIWGDHDRRWTSKSSKDGIMGRQEQKVLDMIAQELGPLKGWMMGYGFDLWEWVNGDELKAWHDYMWSKPGWNKLLGARADKNQLTQIYEGLDISDYEYHKPWYGELMAMINARPTKPSLSGDRYRIMRSRWPEKDYTAEETRRGLWHHTMAGGIGAIWGNLESPGTYPNKEELKCFFVFWNDKKRFKKDMTRDNSRTDGFGLREDDKYYVFYKEDTDEIRYGFDGRTKKVVAVDTKKPYQEIDLGRMKSGNHVFKAPYISDWAIAIE
jgi:hypothetical protein